MAGVPRVNQTGASIVSPARAVHSRRNMIIDERRIARARREVSFLNSAPEQTVPPITTSPKALALRASDSQCRKWGFHDDGSTGYPNGRRLRNI